MVVKYATVAPDGTSLWERAESPSQVGFQLVATSTGITTSVSAQPGDSISTPTSYADDAWHIVIVRRMNQTNLELRVDRAVQAMGTVSSQAFDGSEEAYLAGTGSSADGLTGDIAEFIAVHGTQSDADVTALESYLAAKWAL